MGIAPPGNPHRVPRTLTPRHVEVVTLVAQGLTNAEIARHLGISVHTVKNYIDTILLRTGVRNRTQLAVLSAPPVSEASTGGAVEDDGE